jgi:hypothetical protein
MRQAVTSGNLAHMGKEAPRQRATFDVVVRHLRDNGTGWPAANNAPRHGDGINSPRDEELTSLILVADKSRLGMEDPTLISWGATGYGWGQS